MDSSLIQFLVSAVVIIAAGAVLAQCGDSIANRTKLGGLLVGSILIAGATSLPELAIDINAVRMGSPDLAVGDLLGSSLFNLLILGVLDLTSYSKGRMFSAASGGHAVSGGMSILLTAIVATFILLAPQLEGVNFLRLGPGSIVVIAAYAFGIRLVFVGQKRAQKNDEKGESEGAEPKWLQRFGLKGAIAGFIGAAIAILVAAPFLARAADHIAEESGLGGTFFGSTFVALCTSLPEVATTLAAIRIKAFDMAVGNIFGSNCFNMLLVAPLDLVIGGSIFSAVAQTHVYTALCVIVITSVVLIGQLYSVEKRKPFLEPDALLTIFLIFCALTGLYFLRQ